MNKQITIRIEGAEEAKTQIAALITWALMKLQVRPSYEGSNRMVWQTLSTDEMELERGLRQLVPTLLVSISESTDGRSLSDELRETLVLSNQRLQKLMRAEKELADLKAQMQDKAADAKGDAEDRDQ